ncbi:UrcA family protein [Sphingomonas sp. HITSZ_GF]|uniref:UrcA family protein n=1 Tax=Sphingomonas sp. HITSZ_GF TaxID=3037247 RepID=UPI00240DFC9F|nr:UrcA family protein [Sphingomonas sp. HITSZ_GF]MDG2533909.1 UrcA family protein [Sphingomonas sp. HITSZ_GF]
MYRFALFASLAVGLATPAAGQASYDDPPLVSHVVTFRDLNLATETGAQELDRRILAAARYVCRTPTASNIIPFMYSRRCVDGAVREAQPRVVSAVQLARRNQLRDSAIRVASH